MLLYRLHDCAHQRDATSCMSSAELQTSIRCWSDQVDVSLGSNNAEYNTIQCNILKGAFICYIYWNGVCPDDEIVLSTTFQPLDLIS